MADAQDDGTPALERDRHAVDHNNAVIVNGTALMSRQELERSLRELDSQLHTARAISLSDVATAREIDICYQERIIRRLPSPFEEQEFPCVRVHTEKSSLGVLSENAFETFSPPSEAVFCTNFGPYSPQATAANDCPSASILETTRVRLASTAMSPYSLGSLYNATSSLTRQRSISSMSASTATSASGVSYTGAGRTASSESSTIFRSLRLQRGLLRVLRAASGMAPDPSKMNINGVEPLAYKTTLGFNPLQRGHRNATVALHPEAPARIDRIRERLEAAGSLLDDVNVIEDGYPSVDELDLQRTHDAEHVEAMADVKENDDKTLRELEQRYDSVFLTKDSFDAAAQGVACARHLAELIVEDKIPNGFAIVRPPGHHACRDAANGYCVFNTAAQAAEAAYDAGADRILIVDLDVHHGQGTQRIFYDEKRVLYFSIHRFEYGGFWPHLAESNFNHIGEDEGRGFNVNVPLNETGCGDADYLTILWNVLMPIAQEYDPQLVIVSAGFDSCVGDPLGKMKLTPDCYAQIVYQLKALAFGKLLVVLEGGYNHDVTSVGVERCVRVLAGRKPFPFPITEGPKESTVDSCLNAISALRPFWSALNFYAPSPASKGLYFDPFNAQIRFEPPNSDARPADTADVHQEELVNYSDCHRDATCDPGTSSTVLIWDECDAVHYDVSDKEHPEVPQRTTRILDRLRKERVADACLGVSNEREATVDELAAVHSYEHVERMCRTAVMSDEELRAEASKLDSIFLTRDTFHVARRAAGAALENADVL